MSDRLEQELCFYLSFVLLALGIALLGFALYMLPYAIFNVQYPVPLFVHHLRLLLVDMHGITEAHWQMLLLLLPILVVAAIMLFLAKTIGGNLNAVPTEIVRITEPPATPFGELPEVDPGEESYARKRYRWIQLLGRPLPGPTGIRKIFRSRAVRILLATILLIVLLILLESYLIVLIQ